MEKRMQLRDAGYEICCDFYSELTWLNNSDQSFKEIQFFVNVVDELDKKIRPTVFISDNSHAAHFRVNNDVIKVIKVAFGDASGYISRRWGEGPMGL